MNSFRPLTEAGQLIGESPAFLALLEQASRVAGIDKPALVIGERGTGKELIAERLHYLSPRWEAPFIKLNCATLTEGLLESELFGHEAGAFTGASRRHTGRFERAHGGTLFLDELATVSLRVQEKILRAVEYGEFERVGGDETIQVDVRLIGATNADLPALVEAGGFRADLLDRLAFEVLTVPPLRARPEDIMALAEHFALEITRELEREFFPGFSDAAIETLRTHAWPGNVRELKNAIERSVYRNEPSDMPVAEIVVDPFASPFRLAPTVPADTAAAPSASPPKTTPNMPMDLKAHLEQIETRLIREALAAARYNQKQAAGLLGLTYHQFRARLRRLDIDPRNA